MKNLKTDNYETAKIYVKSLIDTDGMSDENKSLAKECEFSATLKTTLENPSYKYYLRKMPELKAFTQYICGMPSYLNVPMYDYEIKTAMRVLGIEMKEFETMEAIEQICDVIFYVLKKESTQKGVFDSDFQGILE